MLNVHKLAISLVVALILPGSLYAQKETLKFAWPDGASAKVQVRSEGRRVREGNRRTWDMSADFTMQVKRTADRVVVSRNDFSGWKGTYPPGFGGGAERFVDLIPTVIVGNDGAFVGIEGQETARKAMEAALAQAGGSTPKRNALKAVYSDASLELMAVTHLASMVNLWLDVELDPAFIYEIHSQTRVPVLGDDEIGINGTVKFLKETSCEATRADRRCVHLQAETACDKAQVTKLLQSFIQRATAGNPILTAFDQQYKVDIVVEKTTMLPQYLKITRIHNLTLKSKTTAPAESGSEEISTTYNFTWLPTR